MSEMGKRVVIHARMWVWDVTSVRVGHCLVSGDDMEQKFTLKLLHRIEQSHPRFPIP